MSDVLRRDFSVMPLLDHHEAEVWVKEPEWPRLEQLHLGEASAEARRQGIGGSDANIILSGDEEAICNLWRVKRGEEGPEDLLGVLPVMLGCWTEAFNRQWYEQVTGFLVEREGEALCSLEHPWRRCTLDGFVGALGAVWEAKHTSAFAKAD